MKFKTQSLSTRSAAGGSARWSRGGALVPVLLALVLAAPSPIPAQTRAPATYDPAFVEQILKRLAAQEQELKDLRANPPAEASAEELIRPAAFPKFSFHGFGNIDYVLNSDPADRPNSFVLGQLDFFISSQLSENLSVLSETVVEADPENHFAIEIERLLLQWRPSEYFNLDIGRYHTAVGYYNTAYHHGAWFQSAAGRPDFLDFEDGGGLIPAHNVGFSVSGQIPSGRLALHYVAEVGNGRPYHAAASGRAPVLNVSDDNGYKAVNFALLARPEGVPGLQLGAGVYFDRLTPDGQPRTDELLLHAHAVYKAGPWEILSEGYLVRHTPRGGRAATTPAVFAQVARKLGALTPYARFTFLNASENDPVWRLIGSNGLSYGPGVGLRWDFSSMAAFKVQYDFQVRRNLSDLSTLTLQTCFTF